MGEVHHLQGLSRAADVEAAAQLAAELIHTLRELPDWNWLVRRAGDMHRATLSTANYEPLTSGASFQAVGKTPGDALREVRLAVLRGANGVRGLNWDG